jgi:hypothetical protein
MAVLAIARTHPLKPPLPLSRKPKASAAASGEATLRREHAGEGRGEGSRHQRRHSQPSPSRRVASGPSLSRMRERGFVRAFDAHLFFASAIGTIHA